MDIDKFLVDVEEVVAATADEILPPTKDPLDIRSKKTWSWHSGDRSKNRMYVWQTFLWILFGLILFILIIWLIVWLTKLCFNASIVPLSNGRVLEMSMLMAFTLLVLIAFIGAAFFWSRNAVDMSASAAFLQGFALGKQKRKD